MSYRYHHMYIHIIDNIIYIYIYIFGGIYHTYINNNNNTYDGQHLWLPADHLFSPIPMWPKQFWCFLCAHPPWCLGVCDDLLNYQKLWFSIAMFTKRRLVSSKTSKFVPSEIPMPLVSHSNVSACHVSVLDRGVCWISRKTAKKTVLHTTGSTQGVVKFLRCVFYIVLPIPPSAPSQRRTSSHGHSTIACVPRTSLPPVCFVPSQSTCKKMLVSINHHVATKQQIAGRAQHGLTNNHSHSTEQNSVFCVIIQSL